MRSRLFRVGGRPAAIGDLTGEKKRRTAVLRFAVYFVPKMRSPASPRPGTM